MSCRGNLRLELPTTFSPLGGPECPHKEKDLSCLKIGKAKKIAKPLRIIT